MALLAKNSGIVRTWPMPMKRSRVLTRQAMISEKVEKSAAPRITASSTPSSASGCQFMLTPRSSAST